MALLRLAEWILLSKLSQGSNSCNDKTPPRADQANIGSGSTSESLGTPPSADPANGLQRVDQDARSSIACNQPGAER